MTELIATESTIRYCLYARKSTEQDEKQALSIDSQISEMEMLAKAENLNVVDIRKESHSAKDSGMRPVFNEMIKDIGRGMFDGVLTWAPDRLSRNAGDLGSIVDLMDRGTLREVRTHSQRFSNSPNEKFLLMILGSQAKLENDSKGENVKRGLRAKCQMGWRPGMPPIGYLHDKHEKKGDRKIYLDPERAPIVKKMFEKAANEDWNGKDIFMWLREIHFTTRSGKKIPRSKVYAILHDSFYCGNFEYPVGSGVFYEGKHDPLIAQELYDKVQEKLTVMPKLKPGTKEYTFTRLMKCGTCGSGIIAEEKFKKLKDGGVNRYVYYRCGKSIPLKGCKEPYLREEDLVVQFLELMDTIDINKTGIRDLLQEEMERHKKFVRGVLGEEAYAKTPISKVNIRTFAKYVLTEGSRDEKRELLNSIESQLMLRDRRIYLDDSKQ